MNRTAKNSLFTPLILLLFVAFAAELRASTNSIPSLELFGGSQKLTGRLVFLCQHDYTSEFNSPTAATLYEYDLRRQILHNITEMPYGPFFPSENGESFCVIYGSRSFNPAKNTNAFVYYKPLGLRRPIGLDAVPETVALVEGHAFFKLRGYGHESEGHYKTTNESSLETKLIDYDIVQDKKRQITLSGASQWEYQEYDDVRCPPGQTNIVHFRYHYSGRLVKDGENYRDAYYKYDLQTGEVLGPVELEAAVQVSELKTFDGRFVFFAGPAGSDAPAGGFKLMVSTGDYFETELSKTGAATAKKLHSFSRFASCEYFLTQMSPDRRFALIMHEEPTYRKAGNLPGYVHTYYSVDVSNGTTKVLLNDQVERRTTSSISRVVWVK